MLSILLGAAALGLLWAIVTIGVWISYRVLDIPDLTVEGSVVLGASAAAVSITVGLPPVVATFIGMLAGAGAGLITGLLHTKLKIPALLSGILCMIALYSVNIRVMRGTANMSLLRKNTLISWIMDMGPEKNIATIIIGFVFVCLVIVVVYWFLSTERGYAVRAAGGNPGMAKAQGINTDGATVLGLTISNALVGLAGALIAQYQGFSDVQMGQGAIVIGLASLIIGEVLLGKSGILKSLAAVSFGAIAYRVIIAMVIEAGMPATDLKLFTAATVALALYLPRLKNNLISIKIRGKKEAEHAEYKPR